MGVERLQLLIQFSNVSGLLPFRMVLDEQTKRFKRFDGHWRHPSNWWFLSFLLVQFGLHIIGPFSVYSTWVSSSFIYLAVFIFGFFNFSLFFSSLRLFLFRFRHLEKALEIFESIDRLLSTRTRCNSKRRTIIGIVINLIWVHTV